KSDSTLRSARGHTSSLLLKPAFCCARPAGWHHRGNTARLATPAISSHRRKSQNRPRLPPASSLCGLSTRRCARTAGGRERARNRTPDRRVKSDSLYLPTARRNYRLAAAHALHAARCRRNRLLIHLTAWHPLSVCHLLLLAYRLLLC